MRTFHFKSVDLPLKGPFRISRGVRSQARLIQVKITQDEVEGFGECCPYPRYGESQETVGQQLFQIRGDIEGGATVEDLQKLLPPGAARNAVDCALYDLEAKRSGIPVFKQLGLAEPNPFITYRTLSIDTPEAMGLEASKMAKGTPLKVKLDRTSLKSRLAAIRKAAPESDIMVDANEDWTPGFLERAMPLLKEYGVVVIEQPLPSGKDEALTDIPHLIPILADESCHQAKDLEGLKGKYDAINIKLDKTGGLTEGLKLLKAAKARDFKIMLGCMVSSSLSIAPMVPLCPEADFIDLDAPLFLQKNTDEGLVEIEGSPLVELHHTWGR